MPTPKRTKGSIFHHTQSLHILPPFAVCHGQTTKYFATCNKKAI